MNFCRVLNCVTPSFHVSAGHLCEVCGKYGHGSVECSEPSLITYSLSETLPGHLRCRIPGCNRRNLHTTFGHYCQTCDIFGICSCFKDIFSVLCPLCRITSTVYGEKSVSVIGLSQKCEICMDGEISVLLPACRHACMCMDCFRKIAVTLYSELSDDKEDYPDEETYDIFRLGRLVLGNRNNIFTFIGDHDGNQWIIKRTGSIIQGYYECVGIPGHSRETLEAFLHGCEEVDFIEEYERLA